MKTYFLIAAFAVLAAVILINRKLNEKANLLISDSERDEIVRIFNSMRKVMLYPIIIIFLAYFISQGFLKQYIMIINSATIGLFLLTAGLAYLSAILKIRKLTLPKNYLKLFVLSRISLFAGMIIFAAIIFLHGKIN
ncbi:MAG TPA: hypothetical protein PLE16_07965 [Spirochaetota bacterium]|nr:hypothetical protein [Spirochaetota bacterium]HOH38195.1 hypothetical protein [Spirochaetota bacterium]HPJ15107.1 hypothetical protein [Spirochaetota bacterium]HPM34518.1 hypothetical protein [Spirochaetota bacterium]HPW51103.1 hypothetical protein [Spirochaetota bacterium]